MSLADLDARYSATKAAGTPRLSGNSHFETLTYTNDVLTTRHWVITVHRGW
jgi:hypothetical protein